ncbi:MAG: ZIP family metal transporter [Clostridiales bacterium]|nr:ZIP family metal transporter [Clostridiales bacterium]
MGAGLVLFLKKDMSPLMQKIFLGFAAGVMVAASVWSLLIPAMDMAELQNQNIIFHAGGGFLAGGAFLMLLDRFLPHLHLDSQQPEGLPSKLKRSTMLVLAVTLHNIPEGMAVGLAFSVAAQVTDDNAFAGAIALAIGMGLQNFPEGAAISLPLHSQGVSKPRAFLYGALSGIVEPVFGFITVLIAGSITGIMPFVLSFAAGAMIYVVVEELIPEAHLSEHSHVGTVSVMIGFFIMMMLDVLLS